MDGWRRLVLLTLTFEFPGWALLFAKSWRELLADYNLLAGRTWVLMLVVTLLTPVVAFTRQRL